jgi:hypothetical protein
MLHPSRESAVTNTQNRRARVMAVGVAIGFVVGVVQLKSSAAVSAASTCRHAGQVTGVR